MFLLYIMMVFTINPLLGEVQKSTNNDNIREIKLYYKIPEGLSLEDINFKHYDHSISIMYYKKMESEDITYWTRVKGLKYEYVNSQIKNSRIYLENNKHVVTLECEYENDS
ncbi:hypothetical protein CWI39_0573p0010 [Hamiltosporidium magnivora]|uniref:Uncharacterized protein n=1 Tax=Hamiltosporidium magnivora TaxID=148818 RepID=A0A4Q9LDM7_9MICR|nr:hypothetical protein CWI39_0573p0010 [Hamiltosporidium magnivora]